MKKIHLERIGNLRSDVAHKEAELKKALEAKARKRSQVALEEADREIARIKKWKAYAEETLAKYEAEAKEAMELAAAGGEIVVAYVWLDDYGRRDSEVQRSVWKSLEEAEEYYYKIKKGNGGYIGAWIEVREAGEFERIKKLRAEKARIEAELKELGGDD